MLVSFFFNCLSFINLVIIYHARIGSTCPLVHTTALEPQMLPSWRYFIIYLVSWLNHIRRNFVLWCSFWRVCELEKKKTRFRAIFYSRYARSFKCKFFFFIPIILHRKFDFNFYITWSVECFANSMVLSCLLVRRGNKCRN